MKAISAVVNAAAWPHLRAATGLLASGYLVIRLYLHTNSLGRSAIFGIGWGLALLYGVQVRRIAKDGSVVSWTGALSSVLTWTFLVGYFCFGSSHFLFILDLTIAPLASIYIAAKIGCHNIGCCNWAEGGKSMKYSLPLVEVMLTASFIMFAIVAGLTLKVSGVIFSIFILLHLFGWKTAKRFRAQEEA